MIPTELIQYAIVLVAGVVLRHYHLIPGLGTPATPTPAPVPSQLPAVVPSADPLQPAIDAVWQDVEAQMRAAFDQVRRDLVSRVVPVSPPTITVAPKV